MTANRVHVLVCLGRDEEARSLRDQVLERSVERYVSPYAIAEMEAALGNTDSALKWLHRGTEERNVLLSGVVTPGTRVTTDDPRISDLMQSCSPEPDTG